MKVSNKSFFNIMKWLVRMLVGFIFLDFGLSMLAGSLSSIFEHHELALFSAVAILLLAVLRFSFFSYEDEY